MWNADIFLKFNVKNVFYLLIREEICWIAFLSCLEQVLLLRGFAWRQSSHYDFWVDNTYWHILSLTAYIHTLITNKVRVKVFIYLLISEREDCCKLTKKWIPHQKNFYFLLAGKCPYPSSICLNQVFWEHLIYHIATCVATEEPSDMGYQQTLMYGRYSKAERPIKPPAASNISPHFYGRDGQLWSRPWGLWLRKKPGNRSWLREKSQKKCDGDGWV